MFRMLITSVLVVALFAPLASASEISGTYMETRTCQIYTGPCFANAEIGLAGNDAIMAWNIEDGKRGNVDLSGLSVVVVVKASETLAFRGLKDPKQLRSVVFVDDKADSEQRAALIEFAKEHSGRAGESVVKVQSQKIDMSLDTSTLQGKLQAGKAVTLKTRKARPDDCICSNESAYYPPLAKVDNFAPGVTLEGKFSGRGLGSRWSTPGDRSAYMATFTY